MDLTPYLNASNARSFYRSQDKRAFSIRLLGLSTSLDSPELIESSLYRLEKAFRIILDNRF